MGADAGMLATLFEMSMGLGDEWRVSDVWFEEGESSVLHVRVERVPGRAVPCLACGAPCGVHDSRERTWRHLDIWQCETVVYCRVPRVDCPEHGVRTARMPWEVRPRSHFTALFEAQALVMAMSGMTATAISAQLRVPDSTVWRMLGRAVSEARDGADYSGVTLVGIDETACRRGQSYVSCMVDLDGRRVVAVAEGHGRDAPSELCRQLEAHGGDRLRVAEVTRDMSNVRAGLNQPPESRTKVANFSRI